MFAGQTLYAKIMTVKECFVSVVCAKSTNAGQLLHLVSYRLTCAWFFFLVLIEQIVMSTPPFIQVINVKWLKFGWVCETNKLFKYYNLICI